MTFLNGIILAHNFLHSASSRYQNFLHSASSRYRNFLHSVSGRYRNFLHSASADIGIFCILLAECRIHFDIFRQRQISKWSRLFCRLLCQGTTWSVSHMSFPYINVKYILIYIHIYLHNILLLIFLTCFSYGKKKKMYILRKKCYINIYIFWYVYDKLTFILVNSFIYFWLSNHCSPENSIPYGTNRVTTCDICDTYHCKYRLSMKESISFTFIELVQLRVYRYIYKYICMYVYI